MESISAKGFIMLYYKEPSMIVITFSFSIIDSNYKITKKNMLYGYNYTGSIETHQDTHTHK